MKTKKVFVTVGTTIFPKLIQTVSANPVKFTLKTLGYNFLQLQTGRNWKQECDSYSSGDIIVKCDEYFENFEEQIENSDLIISHAGAGSCLNVLRLKKPLIVVVNEDLMDNHQIELAEQLQSDGYVYYCNCGSLNDTLKKDLTLLKPYPNPPKKTFPNYLDKCIGFS